MTIRVCPKCGKAFYLLSSEAAPPCPNCGYVGFVKGRRESVVQALNRRGARRHETVVEFSFAFGGAHKAAKMTDYSETGARIVYHGDPLPVDTLIALDVDKLNINTEASAVWTKKLSITMSSSGLRFKDK